MKWNVWKQIFVKLLLLELLITFAFVNGVFSGFYTHFLLGIFESILVSNISPGTFETGDNLSLTDHSTLEITQCIESFDRLKFNPSKYWHEWYTYLNLRNSPRIRASFHVYHMTNGVKIWLNCLLYVYRMFEEIFLPYCGVWIDIELRFGLKKILWIQKIHLKIHQIILFVIFRAWYCSILIPYDVT